MEFYRQMAGRPRKARLIVVGFESEEILRQYLATYEVEPDQVIQVEPRALRFSGTPTLAAVASDGTIRGIWIGQLDQGREREALEKVR
jgi:hypothetical protein